MRLFRFCKRENQNFDNIFSGEQVAFLVGVAITCNSKCYT